MRTTATARFLSTGMIALVLGVIGCSSNATIFNPAFTNFLSGGVYPLTPGPGADFVFVRVVNETNDVLTFFVTIERTEFVLDDDGFIQTDEQGNFVTQDVFEHIELVTESLGRASEMGTLFSCATSPVIRVGLGANLLPGDPAVFVTPVAEYNPDNPLGMQPGFGVTAENLNALSLAAGNFSCGDTIIFRAFYSSGMPGGVKIESFLLPGSEQPSVFSGRDTFAGFQRFLETQVREDEQPEP